MMADTLGLYAAIGLGSCLIGAGGEPRTTFGVLLAGLGLLGLGT
jgi:hypothetical protein